MERKSECSLPSSGRVSQCVVSLSCSWYRALDSPALHDTGSMLNGQQRPRGEKAVPEFEEGVHGARQRGAQRARCASTTRARANASSSRSLASVVGQRTLQQEKRAVRHRKWGSGSGSDCERWYQAQAAADFVQAEEAVLHQELILCDRSNAEVSKKNAARIPQDYSLGRDWLGPSRNTLPSLSEPSTRREPPSPAERSCAAADGEPACPAAADPEPEPAPEPEPDPDALPAPPAPPLLVALLLLGDCWSRGSGIACTGRRDSESLRMHHAGWVSATPARTRTTRLHRARHQLVSVSTRNGVQD